jgi:hypothetical protein
MFNGRTISADYVAHFTWKKFLDFLSLVYRMVKIELMVELFAYMLSHNTFRYTYCTVLHSVTCCAMPCQPKCYACGCMSMYKEENLKFFRFPVNPAWYVTFKMII